jgi:regulator of CtrA degradation
MTAKTSDLDAAEPVSLHGVALEEFAGSALFNRTFDEAMALVEECARYLDGPGREESRALPKRAALVYAGESMRITTRLMQAASWLLVQRAVYEGEMQAKDAASDRYRLGAREICLERREDGMSELPAKLLDLLERSESLYRRVSRFDDIFFRNVSDMSNNPLKSQLDQLEAAFGTKPS